MVHNLVDLPIGRMLAFHRMAHVFGTAAFNIPSSKELWPAHFVTLHNWERDIPSWRLNSLSRLDSFVAV